MSEDTATYYSVAVLAIRETDDHWEIGLQPTVLRLEAGRDLEANKEELAQLLYPAAEGWTRHEVREYRIAEAIMSMEKQGEMSKAVVLRGESG